MSSGYTHLLTVVDHCTCWPEAFPLASTSVAAWAAAVFAGWMARFGVPVVITSYREVQFTSLVERLHHCLKEGLWAQAVAADWPEHLPWVLSSIRAAAKEASNKSPADLLCSSQLVRQSSSFQKFQFTVPV
jgi:hypothetical protein